MDVQRWLRSGVDAVADWEAGFAAFQPGPSAQVPPAQVPPTQITDERFAAAFAAFTERLRDNYPYFHPSYAGQMLKPPHPAAVVGYLTAMLVNPNNHALDSSRATSQMEKEVIAQLAQMFGFTTHLGHLTSSGTIANLEALYVARELHPDRGVAYSTEAHYTHGRMCGVLGIDAAPVPVDGAGRLDPGALRDLLAGGRIGTVVVTAGTTGLGAIDPVHEVLTIAREHEVRVHVDAAYGGFFALLAGLKDQAGQEDRAGLAEPPWRAIAGCDSVVVDPHKHGLQPYGCGAVLFRDPGVGRLYLHDSPYTYFTSDELHLGEISLECSRSGAAAAALWLTFQVLPPTPAGLGQVLAAGRRAALDWSQLIEASDSVDLYQPPELDIVSYFPVTSPRRLSAIDAASARILADGMADPADPVFVSTLRVPAGEFTRRHPGVPADRDGARILRSVLMKPEHESYVPHLHKRIEQLAAGAGGRLP
jgi:glutamate/tyrosine decarboxylase-like PLP-dependent enzyme